MKKIFLFLFTFACCQAAFPQAQLVKVEYQKTYRDAIINDIPFPEKTVTNAITDSLEKMGYKAKNSKGYLVFQGVKMASLGKDVYDLYFQVDRKSRREKDMTAVTLILSRGLDNFITDASDHAIINNAKSYMDDLKLMVAAYDLEQQITEQDEVVKKQERKTNNLVTEAEDLQKRKKKMEQQIEDNQKEQAAQESSLQKQKQILETLRSRRKA